MKTKNVNWNGVNLLHFRDDTGEDYANNTNVNTFSVRSSFSFMETPFMCANEIHEKIVRIRPLRCNIAGHSEQIFCSQFFQVVLSKGVPLCLKAHTLTSVRHNSTMATDFSDSAFIDPVNPVVHFLCLLTRVPFLGKNI